MTTSPAPHRAAAELPPQYDAAAVEARLYARWDEAGVFHAAAGRSRNAGGDRAPFTIVMPPPNVTAMLHMGHALNNTVQDVLIRWRRMCGDEALWVPGTDHAGIATQNVVEKQLAAEGKTRVDLGRAAFVERTRRYAEETKQTILGQLRAIGCSADWRREAYTFSPALSRAVREAFVRLYDDGLIYRGHRVIHWCPRCLTSLSDEEAEFEDTAGTLWHIRYPLAGDPSRGVTIATTRPETMLADVAIAVHPDDDRYRELVGLPVVLPIAGLEIPIIADSYVDAAFGTGALKITPAHDANDFDVGTRHHLAMPVVISATGTMEEPAPADGAPAGAVRVPPALRGLDRFEARERIVAMLRESGHLVKAEPHQHAVRHCYRCDTVVEPRLSDQWFVKMEPLARPALAGLRNGELRVLPERWEAVYVNWLEGIRDWNISRQLWWGHRVPVWYCDACGWQGALRADPDACPKCRGAVRQDEDVLDTWFSSWLWPLSTLGWPDETADLAAFYPTDVLVTAPEILFFWVARMVMAGYKFRGKTAFHTVYLHGTVRDTRHVKMSKSLGNGIDPLDVVRLYGADALRWTAIAGLGLGADVILDPNDLEKSFAPGRNFCTKLWNIARFLLGNVGGDPVRPIGEIPGPALRLSDRWILGRLDAAIAECDAALGPAHPAPRWKPDERFAGLRLNDYAETARRFVWNELADWYLEAIKTRLTTDGDDRETARAVLVHAFEQALRLLQPIIPFVTDAIWQQLPGRGDGEFLARAPWPRRPAQPAPATLFPRFIEAVEALRQVRAGYAIPPGKPIAATLVVPDAATRRMFDEEAGDLGRLARAAVTVSAAPPASAPGAAHVLLAGGTELVVQLAGVVDVDKECARLRDELTQLDQQLASLTARLANPNFLSKAKPEVVAAEREKAGEWGARREQLARKVASLCG